ncbi:MAG: hypothetical protein U0641_16355 [Anaerolineae bacterium]
MHPLAPRLVVLALVAGIMFGLVTVGWMGWPDAITEAAVAEKPAAQSTAIPLPPTIRPAGPANPAQIATIPPRPVAPGGAPPGAPAGATPAAPPGALPGARPGVPPTLPPAPPQIAPTVGAGGGQPAAPTVGAAPGGPQPAGPTPPSGTVGAGPVTPSAAAVPLRTLSGTVTSRTEQSLEIEIPDRGTITVEPRPQTEIRRDGVKTTIDSIEIGDTATVSINDENFPLAIIVSSPLEATGTSPLWYVLLGVVMLGVTLMLDSDLRRKFMAALLEP